MSSPITFTKEQKAKYVMLYHQHWSEADEGIVHNWLKALDPKHHQFTCYGCLMSGCLCDRETLVCSRCQSTNDLCSRLDHYRKIHIQDIMNLTDFEYIELRYETGIRKRGNSLSALILKDTEEVEEDFKQLGI